MNWEIDESEESVCDSKIGKRHARARETMASNWLTRSNIDR